MVELADLLARCRAGDELAWEGFVRRFQGRIYAIAYAYTGNPDDARDLAQDIFVRLFGARSKWAKADVFMPWLIRTARNLAVDYLRRRRSRTTAGEVGLDVVADLAHGDHNPEQRAESAQRQSLVWRALRRLTTLNREMIILRDIHGLSLEEVAAALRIPIGTAKSRASRARIELAQQVLAISGAGAPEPPR